MKPKRTEAPKMDITLCYQSLGVPFRAAPAEIEKAFTQIMSRINRELASANPAKRKQAQEEQELFTAIHEQIKSSVTYQDSLLEEARKPPQKNELENTYKKPTIRLTVCPKCQNSFNITYKTCPYCKEPNQSTTVKADNNFFSGTTLKITLALLFAGIAAAALFYAEFQKNRRNQQAIDNISNIVFSNTTGNQNSAVFSNVTGNESTPVFTNLTGTTQRP